MNAIETIENRLQSLSRQERKIALTVIQNSNQVKKMNTTDLAKLAEVSTATITRFVKKIGYSTFAEFKISLAESASTSKEINSNSKLSDQVAMFYERMITDTWKKLDQDALCQAIDLIKNSNRIFVYGLGSSGYNAQELAQRLIRMGINAYAPADSHTMYIVSTLLKPDDLVIVLSVSGKSSEVDDATILAKSSGAKIIALTAFKDTPLTETSDCTLLVQYNKFIDDSHFINSQLGIVYVIDIISTTLLQEEEFNKHYQLTVESILSRKK